MAILLSIIPGLGPMYKGHRIMGGLILFLITPAAIAFAIIAAMASAGWGILMLVPYWGAVMLHAWAVDDRIKPTPDEGEQY
jgi:TM2 domain-containing membrane protein YozV